MTIGTDTLIDFFEAGAVEIDSTPGTVANTVMSASGDIDEWTNTDDAPQAALMLRIDTTNARTANRTIGLYASLKNILGTAAFDAPAPTTTWLQTPMAIFYPDNQDTVQHMHCIVDLPNTVTQQVYHFFILNNCGQTILDTWELWIDAKTKGPHA